jgi:hypothetical protein
LAALVVDALGAMFAGLPLRFDIAETVAAVAIRRMTVAAAITRIRNTAPSHYL